MKPTTIKELIRILTKQLIKTKSPELRQRLINQIQELNQTKE